MRERLLVLAVDRDDDLGLAGISTPIIGEDRVLEAATRFALHRPEDSDLNVLFAAVRIARELRASGRDAVVAVVAGSQGGGVEADLRIASETRRVVEETGATGIVFVSDGAEDEFVIPVLESIAPVVSVRRVVVEQHRGVEETYMLIAKYIRKIIEEPRFSRLFLGVPGVVLVVFSSLALLGLLYQALLVGLLVAGLAMVIKGFNLESRIIEFWTKSPVMIVTSLIAVMGYASAVFLSYYMLTAGHGPFNSLVAATIRGAVGLAAFATTMLLLGHAVHKISMGELNIASEVTGLVIVIVVAVLLNRFADAVEAAKALSSTELLLAMSNLGIPWQAMAAVLVVAVTWWFSSRFFGSLSAQTSESSGSS